jgi:hypothetical protein
MAISPAVAEELAAIRRRQGQLEAFERDWKEPEPSRAELAVIQAEYDKSYRQLGAAAPPAAPGEGARSYRGRLVSALLPHTRTFRNSNPYALAGTPAEEAIRGEVAARARDKRRGALRRVEVVDEETGQKRTEYWGGSTRDWMNSFLPPYRVATKIRTFDRAGNETVPPWKWGHAPR